MVKKHTLALKSIQPARRRLADEVYEQLMDAIMSREIDLDAIKELRKTIKLEESVEGADARAYFDANRKFVEMA